MEIHRKLRHAPRERVSWNMKYEEVSSAVKGSRSTWACELKWTKKSRNSRISWSRSTWACELKFKDSISWKLWNVVTLHVSVWVEICWGVFQLLKWKVTLHVSVWVEIPLLVVYIHLYVSRSTWACELKYTPAQMYNRTYLRHAPRERVSWNFSIIFIYGIGFCHAPRERVSWNICLSSKLKRCTGHAPRERVSWNSKAIDEQSDLKSHAPRERVSWNVNQRSAL